MISRDKDIFRHKEMSPKHLCFGYDALAVYGAYSRPGTGARAGP